VKYALNLEAEETCGWWVGFSSATTPGYRKPNLGKPL
jgi:hypothetical protein